MLNLFQHLLNFKKTLKQVQGDSLQQYINKKPSLMTGLF
jgi:hypothetical protein